MQDDRRHGQAEGAPGPQDGAASQRAASDGAAEARGGPQAPPPRRSGVRFGSRSGAWRWVLALSLALNLLVVGFLAGGFLLRDEGPPGRLVRMDLGIDPYMRALAPRDRSALLRDWRARGPDAADILAARRDGHRAVIAALRAEDFDPAELEAALADRLSLNAGHAELGMALLLERVRAMSDEARIAYAARIESALEQGPHGRHRPPSARGAGGRG